MLEPLSDRVIIKPTEAPDMTPGGLHVPVGAREKSQRGEVLAVGPGRENDQGVLIPMRLWVGDVVLFGKYSGTELEVDGHPVLVLRESDIIMRVR